MNEEKYGIQLDAVTSLFKRKMQDLSSFIRKFGKEAEEETTIQPKIEITASKNELLKQKKQLEKELAKAQENYSFFSKGQYATSTFGMSFKKDVNDLEFKLNDVNKQLEQIEKNEKEINEETEEINENASKSTLGELFEKSIGKIKRFTYYLLGARSVFSLFMKYQSIYYQYNEQMQYQSELSQNAIALSLAPAFEFLGNVVAYASIGIAKFIELLTGVNVLSKVTTKGIRDYNKSLKETQTLVSGIDEITNLTLPGAGTGLASQYAALDEFQKKVAEVTKWFEENEWINSFANALKTIWETLGKVIEKIGGIKTVIGIIIGFGLLKKLSDFVIYAGTLNTSLKALGGVSSGTLGNIVSGFAKWAGWIAVIGVGLYALVDGINQYTSAKDDLKNLEDIYEQLSNLDPNTEEYKTLINLLETKMGVVSEKFENGTYYANGMEQQVKGIIEKLDELTGKKWTLEIDEKINIYEKTISDKSQKVKETGGVIAQSWFDQAVGKRRYASGLDYVPYDEYPAILHKGEAVVPAKYNPTIHSAGNEYTNSLLETLIVSVQDLANRPNVFEVDGNEFAKATYPLYRNEENRQNYNAKVSVR